MEQTLAQLRERLRYIQEFNAAAPTGPWGRPEAWEVQQRLYNTEVFEAYVREREQEVAHA